MSLTISVDIKDGVTPLVGRFVEGLTDRTGLHEAIGIRDRNLIRDHFIVIAQTRHDTANRLGAEPSGHWAQAAEKTTFRADSDATTVSINQPGIGRAVHDVTIVPGAGKQWLTIPLIAEAYNQRAYRVPGLFMPGAKGAKKHVLAKRGADGTLRFWYALVKSVTQKQDRTLLPSDEELRLAAFQGVRDYVDFLLSRGGAA